MKRLLNCCSNCMNCMGELLYLIESWLSVVLLAIVGCYYVIEIFANLSQDTTSITNIAFGITASLSTISFSCARTLQKPEDHKDRFAYAGERFFHASVMLITASILKYAALSLGSLSGRGYILGFLTGVYVAIGFIVGMLFMVAFCNAYLGFRILNDLLWCRAYRSKEYDYIFPRNLPHYLDR